MGKIDEDVFIGDPTKAAIEITNNVPLPRKGLAEPIDMDLDAIVNSIQQRDFVAEPLQVLSYGGGVQSTAMLVLITKGVLPKPDIIVFSDTGSELQLTLDNVKEIGMKLASEAGVPFAVVSAEKLLPNEGKGRLHEDYHETATLPLIGIRSCTQNYKIRPQRKLFRRIVGNKSGVPLVESWLGITTDEDRRRTESDVKWQTLKYPLLDDYPMSRQDCKDLLKIEGLAVIKSGCFMCPYSSLGYWRFIKETYPELWEIALKMEEQYRTNRPNRTEGLFYKKGRWLKDLHMPANFGDFFESDDDDDSPSCDSHAGCFI